MFKNILASRELLALFEIEIAPKEEENVLGTMPSLSQLTQRSDSRLVLPVPERVRNQFIKRPAYVGTLSHVIQAYQMSRG